MGFQASRRSERGDLSEAIVDEWNEVDNSGMTLKDYQEYVYQMTGVKFKTTD